MKLQSLLAFIQSHGFSARIVGNAVSFAIPYSINGEHSGYDTATISTMSEARDALGY